VRPYVPPTTLQQTAASSATTSQQIDVSASISSIPGTDPAPADGFSHPQLVRRCIKHIPKSARPACAQSYAQLLRRCTGNPHNLHAWEELLNFDRDVLAQPTRGGKRHNLASVIKKRTMEPHTADHEIVSHKTKSTDAATLLANAVSAKIEDGNIRAAIRMFRRYAGTGQRARTTGRQAPCTSAGPWIRSRSTTDGGCRDDGRRGDPRSTLCSARISRRT